MKTDRRVSARRVMARIWVCALGMVVLMFTQVAWLVYLQLGDHSPVSREWENRIEPLRGGIYDRRGYENPLALSLPGKLVYIDPTTVEPGDSRRHIAEVVAGVLQLDLDYVLVQLNRTNTQFIALGVFPDDGEVERLRAAGLSGLHWRDQTVRHYPMGRTMSHVLGFVNAEGLGSAGIEQRLHDAIKGTAGMIVGKVDARRREIYRAREQFVAPIHGADVILTLDQNVQYVVEQALDEGIREYQASGGWIIVQRVRTGEILAMASRPDYDPNHFRKSSRDLWRNRAIADVFEPGSTLKAVTVAAALNENLIDPETVIDSGNGVWMYAGRPLRDHVRGPVTVAEIIQRSSNVGAAKIALMLGDARLEGYLRAFGFGARLGVDLPGEENGILAPARQWSKLSPTRLAIGQGIAVTGLQMLNLYCTLANDGVMMRPYVVDRVVSGDGIVLYQGAPAVLGRPVRPETAHRMQEMLARVVMPGGTATRAAVPNYTVAGKTGTAQIPVRGGYSNTEFWSSFVGVLPADAAEIGILVVIERPHPVRSGGVVAAPVFARIGQTIAHYLEIPPTRAPVADPSRGIARRVESSAGWIQP